MQTFSMQSVVSQFRYLDARDMGTWPLYPKLAVLLAVFLLLQSLGWYFYWNPKQEELATAQQQEVQLKEQYRAKLQQAINLEELKKQKEQVSQYVIALEKQLPSKSEMDALLSDINQAGIGRGLSFNLFKPGQSITKEYYAELPIQIAVKGSYHDFGSFAADIASLPRIVTLEELDIKSEKNTLNMVAIAKTYRYLDAEELNLQKQEAARQANKAGGKNL